MKPNLVGIVGPCASGKTTLVDGLTAAGYSARHIAQEHSYVKDMWRRVTDPSLLIYLHASYSTTLKRRRLNWSKNEYQVQLDRLKDARKHADLVIETDDKTIQDIYNLVRDFLETRGIQPSKG